MIGMSICFGSLGGLAIKIRGPVAKIRNTEQGAVPDGNGKHASKAWVINEPSLPACTTGSALDGGQVY